MTIKDIKIDEDKLSLTFKEHLIGTYYFNDLEEKNTFINNYSLGDKIKILAKENDISNNTIPNNFNYKKYLYHQKINNSLSIEKYEFVSKNSNLFIRIKNIFYNRVSSINNNSYLYAFILGKSSYIDRDIYNNYKINGVTHLFALSGLHVSLFSGILLKIFKKIKMSENSSYLFTSLFLIFFSFIASFTPSILRATIFFILSSINKIYYLFIKPKNLLYLTFIILVFINPFYIFNNGFLLSFSITFFILLFNENFKINNNLLSILIVSIVSFLGSLPIIINMSYEVNIVGFINNIIFIPFVSYIIFPFALICIIFTKLSSLLLFFTNIMEKISSFSSKIFNLTLYFSKITTLEIVIYYILLILIIKNRKKIIITIFILFLIFIYIKPNFDKNLCVYILDVGQGDSILIKNNKESILIDTGGKIEYKNKSEFNKKNNNYDLMESNLIPFFKSIGLKKINYFITTHGDFDHMGEAINLVENFKVENVIFNCGEYNDLEQELIKVLGKKKIKYYSCIKELNIDKYKLQFLNVKEYDNENDNSNVIYFNYNDYKFLFMGDAGIEKEKDILEKYNLKDIDFLKVGHHGSNTSSSEYFINEINPKYSLISVGKNNRYGHPKDEVLETLKNSKIYRTDLDGSIEIKLNKNGVKTRTCPP